MKNWKFRVASRCLHQFSKRKNAQFINNLTHPELSQETILKKIVHFLYQSQYGINLKIKKNMTYKEFRETVPIVTYDELIPWIERIKQNESKILSPHKINFFEKTSGSSGFAKYIPYSKDLQKSFHSMFQIWVYDLLTHGPKFETGRIFMSLSPPMKYENSVNNIQIGLDDDSQYLKTIWRWMLKSFIVFPPQLTNIIHIHEFRYCLALNLVAEENLEIVSIWNPTYFTIILDTIIANRNKIIQELKSSLSPTRLAILHHSPIDWTKLWPKLKFISCWTDGSACLSAKRLAEFFPHAVLQGKGLLATEAPISIPLIGVNGAVPLIDEVFFEFMDKNNEVVLLHELTVGECYEIIISQQGGLYRYRLGDYIEVIDRIRNTPTFKFIKRSDTTCDLVGEKLTEEFVISTMNNITNLQPLFYILVPAVDNMGIGRYILFSEPHQNLSAETLDNSLCNNIHYYNARIIGQLKLPIHIATSNMPALIQNFLITNGMKWGNIKDKALVTDILLGRKLIKYLDMLISFLPHEKA